MYFESVFQHSFRHSFTSHEGNTFLLHKIANAMFLVHFVQICHFEHPLGGIKWVQASPKKSAFKFLEPPPSRKGMEQDLNMLTTISHSHLPYYQSPIQKALPHGTIISCSFLLSGERLVGDPIHFGRLSCHGETHMSRTVGRNDTKTKQIYVFQMTSFAQ